MIPGLASSYCTVVAAVIQTVLLTLVMDTGKVQKDISANVLFSKLLKVSNVSTPTTKLVLKENRFGIRGVFINNENDYNDSVDSTTATSSQKNYIDQGDILLSVPLSSCVQDSTSKLIFSSTLEEYQKKYDHDINQQQQQQDKDWTFLLAKAFVEFVDTNESILKAWSDLLPDPIELRSSLPLHWSDDSLKATGIESFQKQAKVNRLVQHERIELLTTTISAAGKTPLSAKVGILSTRSLDDVLDLCNTRMCRVVLDDNNLQDDDAKMDNDDDDNITPYYSCCILVPGFDMINHASHGYNNASYKLERSTKNHHNNNQDKPDNNDDLISSYSLVVRSKRELDPGEEILIDYGEETRDFNCLHNYGFLPNNGASVQVGGEIKIPSMDDTTTTTTLFTATTTTPKRRIGEIQQDNKVKEKENESTSPGILNFRKSPYGFDIDLVKLASMAVHDSDTGNAASLGEDEAEWIIDQIDNSIRDAKKINLERRKSSVDDNGSGKDIGEDFSSAMVGMDWAHIVNDVNIQLLSKCRNLLLSERIKNPLRKIKLTLRQI